MKNLDEIGSFYKIFIDPVLAPLHKEALKFVGNNPKTIDIACGTGAFAFKISTKASHVLGIDLSESQIKTANTSKAKNHISNVDFLLKDATNLSDHKDKEFDLATISLALHQFSIETALGILSEMKRISKEIIIVDYIFPMPSNYLKLGIYAAERMAGNEHYTNFKAYMTVGGAKWLINEVGLSVKSEINKSVFCIINC